MALHWFVYIGPNPFTPGSYTRMSVDSTCTDGCYVCAVFLDDNSLGNPSSLSPILGEIANAIGTQSQRSSGTARVVMTSCCCP